ncbi:DUF4177 domain-containing protein [Jannaschia formosa]|uniref:DUF4177 domain-containing protein n=1 Tax=Jannaschia formosa TaxID=2259592 RepID=UPI000E1B7EB5|nr:DUF4177 domain-containing protein [Jannaschia formosa]TFL16782.1 DUF4177 domain-containing protein [Jannaschia formosa]
MRHDPHALEPIYEFTVVPAPAKAERAEGLKTDAERMAATWTQLLNEMALDGWDYVRADHLPNDTSRDLTGTAPKTMTLLVFRRLLCEIAPAVTLTAALRA